MTDQQFGYGQQDPNSTSSPFNSQAFLVGQILGRISTMKPVKVMAVHIEEPGDAGPAGTVDVQPMVNQIDGQGNATAHGTVYGIPYFRLACGANAVIMDPKVGDIGFMVVADRDISAVKSSRDIANPGSRRKFNLADGIYIGGFLLQAPEQYVAFGEDGIKVADKNGNVVETNSSGITITLASGGDFIVNGVSLIHHKHAVTTAPGDTGEPIPEA